MEALSNRGDLLYVRNSARKADIRLQEAHTRLLAIFSELPKRIVPFANRQRNVDLVANSTHRHD